jgi:hypothetical protein
MSYPFLPPNPCCTATPASSPCATGDPCLIITTDQVKYNGSELLCIGVDPCDTMTTALQKINTKQCSTDASINSLNSQISIIENQINIINETLISIVNQLDVCCSTTTTTTLVPPTTTTTTICPCFTYDVTISLDDINNADDSRVNVNVPLDCNEQVNSKYEFFAPGTFTVCASNISEPPTQYIIQSFASVPTVDQPVITPECCTITIERGSITSTSELTALSACSAPLNTVAYIESNYVRVFTDPLGTLPFIGDGNFYRIQREIDDPVTVTARINSDGYVISSITIC